MIFLTGPIRGGTTWAGNMIGLSKEVKQVTEILNPYNRQFYGTNWQAPFFLVSENDSPIIESIIGYNHSPKILFKRIQNVDGFSGKLKLVLRHFKYLFLKNKVKLIKDPHGIFSAEFFFKTYNSKVLVISRHPAAFVSSMRRMKWGVRFSDLINQKNIDRSLLLPFLSEKEFTNLNEYDTSIEGLSALWNIIHNQINVYKLKYSNHPDWFFVSHEALSEKPVDSFEEIFKFLNLTFSNEIIAEIRESTNDWNPIDAKENEMFTLKRNSKENVNAWKKKLSKEEQDVIQAITQDVLNELNVKYRWDE